MYQHTVISLIVAVAHKGVIGNRGSLPWRIPADMRHFMRVTWGHTVIVGRKTFETFRKPLEGRRVIVLTRQQGYQAAGVEVAHSVDAALVMVRGEAEVFVAGGVEVYAECLPLAGRLYLTRIDRVVEGDSFFPEVGWDAWREVERQAQVVAEPGGDVGLEFLMFERVS